MRLPGSVRAAAGAGALLLAGLAAGPATAREPDWLQRAISAPADGGGARGLVLVSLTEVRADARLEAEVHERRAVRILTPAGLDLASFEPVLLPGAELRHLSAWTVGPQGRRDVANEDAMSESTLFPDEYSDCRRITIRAPGAQVGDVVAIEWVERARLPFPEWYWSPQEYGLPVARAELTFSAPPGWTLEARGTGIALERGPAPGPLTLSLGPLPPLREEPWSPPWTALLPRVHVGMLDPAGTRGFRDWNSAAAWYWTLSGPRASAQLAPAELLRAAPAGASPAATIAALAGAVQHGIQYAAIELGRRRWEPDSAAATWMRRYGDCKDKAILLVAALRARGIEARPALTCTRDRWDVDPASPDLAQFNHCIVAIPWPDTAPPAAATVRGASGRAWTFFDPTAEQIPLGLLPPQDAGAWALIAEPGEGLVRLPEPTPSGISYRTRCRLDGAGTLEGAMTVRWSGYPATALASEMTHGDPKRLRVLAASRFGQPWMRPVIGNVRWLGFDSTALEAGAEIEFRLPDAALPSGADLVVRPLLVGGGGLGVPPSDTTRTLPVVLPGAPLRIEERLEVELPEGMVAEGVPEVRCEASPGAYRVFHQASGRTLVVTRTLEYREPVIPAGGYPDVLRLCRAVARGDQAAFLARFHR